MRMDINWSEEEEELLKKLYPIYSVREISKVLVARTQEGIRRKAERMDLVKKKIDKKIDYEYLKNMEKIHEI